MGEGEGDVGSEVVQRLVFVLTHQLSRIGQGGKKWQPTTSHHRIAPQYESQGYAPSGAFPASELHGYSFLPPLQLLHHHPPNMEKMHQNKEN